jgi:hypothetical protein
MSKPIFILDVDNTIIGDIKPQVNELNLIENLKLSQKKLYRQNLISDLKNGIIRPFFIDFINFCKENKIPIFIFTASTKEWINYLLPIIEKIINYKFERPIFTRQHMIKKPLEMICNDLIIKSINHIKPSIYKTLKKKYSYDKSNTIIYMIDNRIDNILEKKYVLHCKSYNFLLPTNLIRSLTEEQKYIYKNRISKYLYNKEFDYTHLMIKIYSEYLNDLKLSIINNRIKNDNYWKLLTIMIKQKNIILNRKKFYRLYKKIFNNKKNLN